jgi:hypothetical protein
MSRAKLSKLDAIAVRPGDAYRPEQAPDAPPAAKPAGRLSPEMLASEAAARVAITIRLPADLHEALRAIGFETRRTKQDLIETAIAEMIARLP